MYVTSFVRYNFLFFFLRYNFHVCLVSWGALAPGGTPSQSIIEALEIELKLLLLLSIQDIPSTLILLLPLPYFPQFYSSGEFLD